MKKKFLTELLVESGKITPETITKALEEQARSGGRIGSIIVKLNLVSEKDVIQHLSKQLGIPGIDLSTSEIKPENLSLIPEKIAQKYLVLPIIVKQDSLTLAMADPLEEKIINEIEFMTGKKVTALVALEGSLKKHIEENYRLLNKTIPETAVQNYEESTEDNIEIVADFQTVPVADDVLITQITEGLPPIYEKSSNYSPAIKKETPAELPPLILIVDDEPDILSLWENLFSEQGYRTVSAKNGQDALNKITTNPPDLILLDAFLPNTNGFEVCQRVKKSDHFKHIPIIMVTAVYKGWGYKLDAQEKYGADEYLEKPVSVKILTKTVKDFLKNKTKSLPQKKDPEIEKKIEAYIQTGASHFKQKKYTQAMDAFKNAVSLDQLNPIAYYYLGKTYEVLNMDFQAMDAFLKSIIIDPYFFLVAKDLALLYEKNGFKNKAIEYWTRAISICKKQELKEKIKKRLIHLLD